MMSKGLEAYTHLLDNIDMETYFVCNKDLDTIVKGLKALDIIISKRLNVDEIYHKDYEWYLLDHRKDDSKLIPTKEEYDLLKEVLYV